MAEDERIYPNPTRDDAVKTEPWAGGFDDSSDTSTTSVVAAEQPEQIGGQAKQVGREAQQAGQRVAAVGKDEAQNVLSEAGEQARNLVGQTRTQLLEQASTQQANLAGWLRALGDELHHMGEQPAGAGTEQTPASSGVATEAVRQASSRVTGLASWLDQHGPGEVLDEVGRFARRRPGTFLLIAASAGLLAGRLTRGLTGDANRENSADADERVGSGRSDATAPASLGSAGAAFSGPAPDRTAGGISGETVVETVQDGDLAEDEYTPTATWEGR